MVVIQKSRVGRKNKISLICAFDISNQESTLFHRAFICTCHYIEPFQVGSSNQFRTPAMTRTNGMSFPTWTLVFPRKPRGDDINIKNRDPSGQVYPIISILLSQG